MAAEVVKQLRELRAGKVKTESDICTGKEDLCRTNEEIKALKARRSECLKERKEEEAAAYQGEQELSELKRQIFVVLRDIETCKIELDEFNWDLSRLFFKFAKRKRLTEQIKEKKRLIAEHQQKLTELEEKKSELEKKPRYEETVEKHVKIKEKLDMESDEKQAHLTLVQTKLSGLMKEFAELCEKLAPVEEEVAKLLESGEMKEEELNAALLEKPEEEKAPEPVHVPAEAPAPAADFSEGVFYAPGEEPAELQDKLSELFEKLEEAYPDHVVVGLHANHKQLGKKVTELYRLLGYDNGNEFLAAYGYTSKRRRPWG